MMCLTVYIRQYIHIYTYESIYEEVDDPPYKLSPRVPHWRVVVIRSILLWGIFICPIIVFLFPQNLLLFFFSFSLRISSPLSLVTCELWISQVFLILSNRFASDLFVAWWNWYSYIIGGLEFVLIYYRCIDVSRFFIFDHDRIMWVTWSNGLREICQT
jgi:hypothetical protein